MHGDQLEHMIEISHWEAIYSVNELDSTKSMTMGTRGLVQWQRRHNSKLNTGAQKVL